MKKWSLGYAILKVFIGIWHYLFYNKIDVTGKENIPKNEAVVFAPNHQNALMDALAIIFSSGMQPVFLARADIFSNSVISAILRYLRILPVYRIRDGADNLSKNEGVFNDSINVLKYGKAMAVFPEAAHTGYRHLRKLKKGIPRIVFQAEEENNYSLPVKIMPVGIYYTNYENMKSDILINYGEPIDIALFISVYKDNKQKGMAALRLEMENRIKELMIHVTDMDNYDFYEKIRELNDYEMMRKLGLSSSSYNKFKADKETIRITEDLHDKEPEIFNMLKEKTLYYFKDLEKFGLKDYLFDTKAIRGINAILCTFYFIISLPVHIYGLLFNYPVYKLLDAYIPTIIKDPQFRSSLKFGVGLVLFPLWYLLLGFLSGIFIDNFWYILAFVISLPVLGLFTLNNWIRFKSFILDLRYFSLSRKKEPGFVKLSKMREEIKEQLSLYIK